MPTARFQANFSQSAIDADAGVIKGVKIMQLGKVATFSGPNGEPKSVTIAPAHIKRLLDFAGNRAIVSHRTHQWFDAQGKSDADSVEMDARIGAFKQLRKDDGGDLVGDFHLMPGPERDNILWGAANNPEDNMISVVFSYDKNDPLCMPLDFKAADLVPTGAATTALFSETKPDQNMPITLDDLKEVCSTPEGKEMLRSAIKGHDNAEAQMEESAAAEMESDAGVTDADKKKEDDQKPALMRAQLRCNRALARMSKSLSLTTEQETALLGKAKTEAKAEVTALLGNAPFLNSITSKKESDDYTATLSKYTETAKGDVVVATRRLLHDHPEFTPQWEAAQRQRMAKLVN